MGKQKAHRSNRILLDYAEKIGLEDFRIVSGRKHYKIYVADQMIGVISHGESDHRTRAMDNTFACMKRFARDISR